MKKSVLSMMLVIGSVMANAPSAHAIAMTRTVAQCSAAMDDASIQVSVLEDLVGLFPNPKVTYTAYVTQSMLQGPLSSIVDVRDVASTKLGAPVLYEGENFTLEIIVDAAPSPQGIPAYLTINRDGIEMAQMELRCTLN